MFLHALVHSFLLVGRIVLCIVPVHGYWLLPGLAIIKYKCYKHFHRNLCVDICFVSLGKCLAVGLLDVSLIP